MPEERLFPVGLLMKAVGDGASEQVDARPGIRDHQGARIAWTRRIDRIITAVTSVACMDVLPSPAWRIKR
jgi:hypothetical protein